MTESKKTIKDFYGSTEQIAERFGRSVRTIKHWIRNYGMPVYQETPKSTYMAFESELQEWIPEFKQKLLKKKR